MSRQAKPWFRTSKNTWYATLNGRKISLGVSGRQNKAEARKAWHRLMAEEKPQAQRPASTSRTTVKAIIDGFLADVEARARPGTLRNYRLFLLPFAKVYGTTPADALTPADAEAFSRKPEWSSTYRSNFLASLVSAVRWAMRVRLISQNPLHGLRKPPKASRGAKALVSAEEHATLVKHATPLFGAFLRLLWLTGARPGEIASLQAEDVDLDEGVALLTTHKTAHLGKSRMLFLSPEAVEIVRNRLQEHPTGLLFPGELKGERLSPQAIGRRIHRLCVKAGIRPCIAYGYRHSFATDALAKGVPDAHVAELLGHSGTAMLHRHYSHLTARAKALRDALGQIR
jgi:integrase